MARDRLAPPPPDIARKRGRLFAFGAKRHEGFASIQPDAAEFAIEPVDREASVSSAALRQVGDEDRNVRRKRRDLAQADRTWQAEAYDYARKIGELGYLLNLQANTVALCDFPLRRWEEDEAAWVSNDPDDDGFNRAPADVMEAFYGPAGGPEELYRRAALHLFTAGETNLLGTAQETGNGILWEFLSVLELYPNAEGKLVRKRPGQTSFEIIDDDHYTARLWRSAGAYSDLAESEVQRVLPICQEIVYLTQLVDANVKSRIPANILFVPQELSFGGYTPSDDEQPGVDTGDEDDPLDREIYDHFTIPVGDQTSASRLVPLLIRGAAEYGQYIQVIEVAKSIDVGAQELRQEALGRLAHGLDTPPEIMSGRANINHWTSAIIDQDFIVKHIIPIGRLIADFVTVAYLRPMLEAFEGMSAEEAMAWKIEFDPSPVVARADESKSARDLSDLLSDQAIIEANGFTKADMVLPEDKTQRRMWQLVTSSPQVFARLLPKIEGFEDIDIDELLAASQGGMADNAPFDKEEEPPETEEGVPDTDDLVDATTGQETPDKPEELSLLTERVTVAADAALRRALERAGSRIVSKAQGEQFATIRDRIASARKDRVASLLTPAELRSFQLTPERLLDKAWDSLANDIRSWTASWLEQRGLDRFDADDRAALVAALVCSQLNDYACDRLLEGFDLHANGLRIPTGLVVPILEDHLLPTRV